MKLHGKSKLYLVLFFIFIFIFGSSVLPMKPIEAANQTTLPAFAKISAGVGHALALGKDGTLWSWGDNSAGELGDNTYISRSSPVQVGKENRWIAVAAGDLFSAAIKQDGSLWLWGTNVKNRYTHGQPSIINQNTPQRYGKENDWVKISAGDAGLAAIRRDGSIWQFGLNVLPGVISNGRLNPDKDWIEVSVGVAGLLALKKDGSLWAMGNVVPTGTNSGKLLQIGSEQDFDQIAASNYSVVRKKDGSVWAVKSEPGTKSYVLEQVQDISGAAKLAGDFVSEIIDQEGTLWRWSVGSDQYEQIPCAIKLTDVDDGGTFGVALDENGDLWTYGGNFWGQRGNGISDSTYEPNPLEELLVEETASDESVDHTLLDKVFTPWNTYTLLGNGSLWVTHEGTSEEQLGSDTDWISLEGNINELYALKIDGSLWTYRTSEQAPSGMPISTAPELEPFQPGSYWKSVKVTELGYVIGLKQDGSIWFWGRDSWKMVLKGAPNNSFHNPIQLSPNKDWQSISVSYSSILAIKKNGTLWGLGDNRLGQLGIPATSAQKVTTFTKVGNFADWTQVEIGETTTVGVRNNGSLWQWGLGFSGKLTSSRTIAPPAMISQTKNWVKVWNTGEGAFALQKNGNLWAWGDNSYGQLGTGTAIWRTSPTPVKGQGIWKDLFVSLYYTVGVKSDGSVWTWGNGGSEFYYSPGRYDFQLTPVQSVQDSYNKLRD